MGLTEDEQLELSDIMGKVRNFCDDWNDRRRAEFLINKKKAETPPGTPGDPQEKGPTT